MKIPKARQLPSGTWFCQLRLEGRSIPISGKTEEEVVARAMAMKAGIIQAKTALKRTELTRAIDHYIDQRKNVLSPSTIRGYRLIQAHRFQAVMHKDISSITAEQWQRAINLEAKRYSAKTLVNSWRFLASVISDATGTAPNVRFPQVQQQECPWLTPEQIPIFVSAIHGSSVEIPALLALSSLRCSEILDLTWDDIDLDAGTIRVCSAAVQGEDNKLIHNARTKNKTSKRIVPIIPPLESALSETSHHHEYVVTMTASGIRKRINDICAASNLPKIGIHGLRHSFASLAYHLNLPEKITMEIGGWSNDQIMHKIYTHISRTDITAQAAILTAFYKTSKNEFANKSANK